MATSAVEAKTAWDGREVSIGTSAPPHAVTPRLLGSRADAFRELTGICPQDGCPQIRGHSGGHTACAAERGRP